MSAKISDINGGALHDGRRSKSQVSVFDYPEHLNPFYEDENHKRLRFWKIGKKDGTSSRRGSFSLGGLREMWAFKSLRGKKKSSTLGINKTSESPEPLRRTYGPGNDNHYGTYDPRYRNTYDNGTINGNFQRNVPYRTSLQTITYTKDINSNGNGIGFMRNDTYRSTIQITGRRDNVNSGGSYSAYTTPTAPPRRYVYGGSVTPQPRTRFDHNTSSQGFINRGPSQLSVASSTNPFEDDYDDDDQSVSASRLSVGGSECGDHPTPAKRRAKKKRRAPPPPVPIPKSIDEETSNNSIPTSPTTKTSSVTTTFVGPATTETQTTVVETKIVISSTPTPPPTPTDEDEGASQQERFENQLNEQMKRTRDFSEQEKLEISNIAAEIEHYVKLLSQDDDDESSIRLIPVTKPTSAPVLKKSKSSTSIAEASRTSSMKKSGSESLMRALLKKNAGPTKTELNKWRESSLKQKKVASPVKVAEVRRNSVDKPVPASRQRPAGNGSPTAPKIVGVRRASTPNSKSASPEHSPSSSPVKPTPSARQPSSLEKEVVQQNTIETIAKREVVTNGILPNIIQQPAEEVDNRSASSKENTPLNSSYGTTTDESTPASIELKITESREDVSDVSNASSERYQIRYVPLKEGTPDTPQMSRKEYKSEFKPINDNSPPSSNTSLVYNESWVSDQQPRRVSVERRRSVKEIIDSINRSQSLLKVNQEAQKSSRFNTSTTVNNLNGHSEATPQQSATTPPRRSSKDSPELQESYRKLSQSEAEIKRMIVEMESLAAPREIDTYCDNVPSILDRFDEEVNNNDIFKKCVLKKQLFREGSPTASNLDWNPLPKPKRTKNLSVVLNNENNASNANTSNGKDKGK